LLRILVILLTFAVSQPVWADPKVGVVVTGNDKVREALETEIGGWLKGRKFNVAGESLDKDGLLTLSNCIAISDMACARGVVEARATSDSVVVVSLQASGAGPKKQRDQQLSAYWIAKKRDVVSLQRMCNKCNDEALLTTIEALMTDLAKLVPSMTGKVKINSTPAGLLALIDNTPVGVTPADPDTTPGAHHITLSVNGKVVDQRDVTVTAGETIQVDLTPPKEKLQQTVVIKHRVSKVIPVTMMGVGGAALITGIVFIGLGGSATGDHPFYTDYRPPGYGLAAGGAAVAAVGVILFLRGGVSSTPTASIGPGQAMVGWAGRF
jgi:hypothetical protein